MDVTATRTIQNDVGVLEGRLVFTDAELDQVFKDPANNALFAKFYSAQWELLSEADRAQVFADLTKLVGALEPTALNLTPEPEEPGS